MPAYCYTFASDIPIEEVEASLLLATWAIESLYGEAALRLEARYEFETSDHQLTIGTATEVGRDLNKILLGFLRREFTTEQFQVEPLPALTAGLAWKHLPPVPCR